MLNEYLFTSNDPRNERDQEEKERFFEISETELRKIYDDFRALINYAESLNKKIDSLQKALIDYTDQDPIMYAETSLGEIFKKLDQ